MKTAPEQNFTQPSVSLKGLDSIKVGDVVTLKFNLTGTPPFSLTYTDGVSNISVNNIDSNSFSVSVKPVKSLTYKPVSIKDKNTSGNISGEHSIWVQQQFKSKTSPYSSINKTVGNIQNNIFFRGNYYHLDDINQRFTFELNNNKYQMSDHSYTFLDYNQDGYLDLFGWCYNLTPVMGRNSGKYIVVDNILGSKRKITFHDSDIAWPSGMETNDFNKDGISDVVFYSYNTHNDMGGLSLNKAKPVKVFLFNKDGSFKETDATEPVVVHDMATGDINNDGAVDMLVWEYSSKNRPKIFINNGLGAFNESAVSNITGLQEIMNTRSNGIVALATELIDLNDDGNLDIIFSANIGGSEWDYRKHNEEFVFRLTQQRILWGSGNGKYDFKSNYTDLPNNSIEQWSRTQPIANDSLAIFNKNAKIALGFNFLDFNNDGKMDIVTAITPAYNGYILQLHQNMGNKIFKDVTTELVGNYNGANGSSTSILVGNFPNFYEIRPYDIDDDGDYDLVPHGVACWNPFNYSKNFYWENIGGKFVLHR